MRRGVSVASKVVLDASAVLAFLFREPGGERVQPMLAGATISAVNMSEVLGRLARVGMPHKQALAAFVCLDLAVAAFGEPEAVAAAQLASRTGSAGYLSLGDRACLATALALDLPVVTADRQWAGLKTGVEVRLIR